MDEEPPSLAELAQRAQRPRREPLDPLRFDGGGYRDAPRVRAVFTDSPQSARAVLLPMPPPAPRSIGAWFVVAAAACLAMLVLAMVTSVSRGLAELCLASLVALPAVLVVRELLLAVERSALRRLRAIDPSA